MSEWQMVLAVIGVLIVAPLSIYITARLVFSAYFFTKREFDKRKDHG